MCDRLLHSPLFWSNSNRSDANCKQAPQPAKAARRVEWEAAEALAAALSSIFLATIHRHYLHRWAWGNTLYQETQGRVRESGNIVSLYHTRICPQSPTIIRTSFSGHFAFVSGNSASYCLPNQAIPGGFSKK